MTQDRYIRCGMFVALFASAGFSAHNAQTPGRAIAPATSISVAPVVVGATTRARAFAYPGLKARVPRALEPFVLSQELRDSLVVVALAQLGAPYVLGGATPKSGFDCSGLVRYAVSQIHMAVPRTAFRQAEFGAPIRREELQRGDLIAFGETGRVTHVGIYVGAGRFVHASSVAGKVILSSLDRRPSRLIRPMTGARRLLATSLSRPG